MESIAEGYCMFYGRCRRNWMLMLRVPYRDSCLWEGNSVYSLSARCSGYIVVGRVTCWKFDYRILDAAEIFMLYIWEFRLSGGRQKESVEYILRARGLMKMNCRCTKKSATLMRWVEVTTMVLERGKLMLLKTPLQKWKQLFKEFEKVLVSSQAMGTLARFFLSLDCIEICGILFEV